MFLVDQHTIINQSKGIAAPVTASCSSSKHFVLPFLVLFNLYKYSPRGKRFALSEKRTCHQTTAAKLESCHIGIEIYNEASRVDHGAISAKQTLSAPL